MKQFKKYIGKVCNEKTKKNIVEEFSFYKVYFHPVGALVQLDSQDSRIRVFYNEKEKIESIQKG